MTKALRIRHGLFGRVAVLEMDRRLVVHAHPQAHLLFKVAGADSAFGVHDRHLPLSAEWAVAVNPWEPHCYPRSPGAAPSLILALHIDPLWLAARLDGIAWPQCFPGHGVRVSPGLRTLVSSLNAEMIYGGGEDRAFVEGTARHDRRSDPAGAVRDERAKVRMLHPGRADRSSHPALHRGHALSPG